MSDIVVYLDILRALIAVSLFGVAAYNDYDDRHIPDYIWNIAVISGAILFSIQILSSVAPLQLISKYAVNVGIAVVFGWGIYMMGRLGGADTKAITAFAVLFPTFPFITTISALGGVYSIPVFDPIAAPPYDFVLPLPIIAFLGNTAIFGLFYPVILIVRSVRRGIDRSQFLNSVFGKEVAVDSLSDKHGVVIESSVYDKAPASVINKYRHLSKDGIPTEFLSAYLEWYRESYDSDATLSTVDWKIRKFLDENDEFSLMLETNKVADSISDVENSLKNLQKQESVLVTPKFPFIVPMFFATLAVVTLGDLSYAIFALL